APLSPLYVLSALPTPHVHRSLSLVGLPPPPRSTLFPYTTLFRSSGAVVAGAQVTVTQQSTSVKRSATTNASGNFTVPSLLPASYSVTIEAAGFKTVAQTVTVLADQIRDLNVRLEVGHSTQQRIVEAAPVLVNTITPVLSQVIEQSRVEGIPLVTRNAADLT